MSATQDEATDSTLLLAGTSTSILLRIIILDNSSDDLG